MPKASRLILSEGCQLLLNEPHMPKTMSRACRKRIFFDESVGSINWRSIRCVREGAGGVERLARAVNYPSLPSPPPYLPFPFLFIHFKFSLPLSSLSLFLSFPFPSSLLPFSFPSSSPVHAFRPLLLTRWLLSLLVPCLYSLRQYIQTIFSNYTHVLKTNVYKYTDNFFFKLYPCFEKKCS